MNNEETILDPQYSAESQKKEQTSENTSVEQPKTEEKKDEKKELGWGEKAAYAAGGAVVGAGVTLAGQAMAAPSTEKVEIPEEEEKPEDAATAAAASEESASTDAKVNTEEVAGVTVEANGTTVHVTGDAKVEINNGSVHVSSAQVAAEPQHVHNATTTVHHASPEPEDAIVATATGVRVAQVDDSQSFSQAFADARAQVGPGGVFEWHGRAYSTYYKDEWDSMTAEQKHDYQASIDYNDVLSDDSMARHHNDMAHHNASHHSSHASYDDVQAQHVDNTQTGDVDVQVLEVGQTDLDGNGVTENSALLSVNGHEVLIVDVDHDGIADVALADVDNDGQLEAADMSDAHLAMPEQSAGDTYMAQADSAPDYMNDANVGLYEA